MAMSTGDRSEIVFFDLETTRPEEGSVIVEFGASLVCPRTLVVLRNYSTLVRPIDPTLRPDRHNGITKDALDRAPTFAEIADIVDDLLHGRIWAGHNILGFDCDRITEAFTEINRPVPKPKGTIDSYELLTQRFGNRTNNMKMATLAQYFGLGKQTHRSLEDIRMNIEVLKCCAAVLLLESCVPDNSWLFAKARDFLEPHDIKIPDIWVAHEPGSQKIQIWHRHVPLKLSSGHLGIRLGISTKFADRLISFVVDPSPILCKILETCDSLAHKLFLDSGKRSEWLPVIRKEGSNPPTLRLRIPTEKDGDNIRLGTEIYRRDSLGFLSRLGVKDDIESVFTPGNLVVAYFSLDTYDYQQQAGIRVVAEMLILHF